MPLGVTTDYLGEIPMGDTASLRCVLTINGQPVLADQITEVLFTVQYPTVDLTLDTNMYTVPVTEITFQDLPPIPTAGTLLIKDTTDVEAFQYTGVSGNTVTGVTGGTDGAIFGQSGTAVLTTQKQNIGVVENNGSGFYLWEDTSVVGPYLATCQFHLVTGEKRSVYTSFTVIDPFNPPDPTPVEEITEAVWLRLSDLMDSTEGGPWLRDVTLANFDQNKIAQFIPEALFDINTQMPPTTYDIQTFTSGYPSNPNMPLLIKGTLCLVIRHLMRSYTEIYTPTGQGQLVWADRTRYQQAWGAIYQIEEQDFISSVRLFKRTEYAFGSGRGLILSRAGRIWPYGNISALGAYRGFV